MPFEWFVALRFLREGRTQTLLILSGVSVGIAVIVFLSALIDGLQVSLVKQTLGSQAHIVVRPLDETARQLTTSSKDALAVRTQATAQRVRSIDGWQQRLTQIDATSGVVGASPAVLGAAFATRGEASASIAVRGVDPDRFARVIDLRTKLRAGTYRVGGQDVLIGTELAQDLGATPGDKIRLTTATGRGQLFSVSGIFDLGNKDANERWAIVSLRSAQTLLDLDGGASTIEIKIERVFEAETIAEELARSTGLVADSWMKTNAQLLVALRSQSSSRYMIEVFVILAVALGIASVLVVSVVQKSREIGIMKAFGTSTGRITRVFLIQGGVVGLIGWIAGSALGAILSATFASLAKNPDGSPLFPIALTVSLVLSAGAIALGTGLCAAVVPARRAARLDPVVAIRA